MRFFVLLLFTFHYFTGLAQFSIQKYPEFVENTPEPFEIESTDTNYAEQWFSLTFELENLGEISPASPLPFTIFPDSTVIIAFNIAQQPIYAQRHGIADVICPSRTPEGWINDWGRVIVDSLSFSFNYIRNTDSSIVDTVFADILKFESDSFAYVDLNQNLTYEDGEFFHRVLYHTGSTEEINSYHIKRTDTLLFYSTYGTTPSSIKYYSWDVNDTVQGGDQYGVYLRFRPGFSYNTGDTLSNYNQFSLIGREQTQGESPKLLWPVGSGFCTYTTEVGTRYNFGSFQNRLVPGVVQYDPYLVEHLNIFYKLTTHELGVKELPNLINQVSIAPNPANTNQNLNIQIDLQKNQLVRFELLNLQGKVVKRSQQKLLKGNQIYNFQLPNIPPGYYTLNVNGYGVKLLIH